MSRFVDIYLSARVPGKNCIASPRFKTRITMNAGGRERSNQEWRHPLHRYTLPEAIARDWPTILELQNHFRIMRGPHRTWPWRDPLDFASRDLARANERVAQAGARITATDQQIGTGDGFTDTFQLKKTYTLASESYSRDIHLPRAGTVKVAVNGALVPDTDYTVTRPGGVLIFNDPPSNGAAITAGYLFDVEVRFESDDSFDAILRAVNGATGFADLVLIEVRPC